MEQATPTKASASPAAFSPASWSKRTRIAVFAGAVVAFMAVAAALRGCRVVDDHTRHTVEQLVGQAEAALAALDTPGNRKRRRPVPFDAVLRPVDMLIAKAKDALLSAASAKALGPEGVATMEEGFNLAMLSAGHARALAARGRELAFVLSNPNNPTVFRFPEQQGEAGAQLATVRWARLQNKYAEDFDDDDRFQPPSAELEPIRADIAMGLAATQRNKELHYLDGTVKLVTGDFAGAADAFRRAIQIDAQYGEAYAGLGRACVELRDYEGAEKAFADLVVVGDKDLAAGRGADALRDGLFNAAMFHDALAEGYAARAAESPADREQAATHRDKALALYRRFLQTDGFESDPSVQTVRDRAGYWAAMASP